MLTFLKIAVSLSIVGMTTTVALAQMDTLYLENPSLEDYPHAGGDIYKGIRYWTDCGKLNFPGETPPDVHGSYSDFFEHQGAASHGSTYIGLVSRTNDTYESISQALPATLLPEQCYEFAIDLMRSDRYMSGSKERQGELYNYNKPIMLYVYGGTGVCGDQELLATTEYVKNTTWETYRLRLTPTRRLKYITLEVSYKRPTLFPYNGNILLDNIQPIIQVPCDEESIATMETPELPPVSYAPPHKTRQTKTDLPAVSMEAADLITATPKKKILDLDRKDIRKDQRIEIKNLYFEADTSTIGAGSTDVLVEVYDFLASNRDITIEIGGHTNNLPSHTYCDRLSSERAKEVATYLVSRGIDPSRLTYKGYGKRRPKASNSTKAGRQKNQRVEITITSMDI